MKQDNIIPFRQPNKRSPQSDIKQIKRGGSKAKCVIKAFAKGTVFGLFILCRYALFFLLLLLRRPIKFVLRLVAAPTLFIAPIIYFGLSFHPQKSTMLTWLISAGSISFVLLWFYDSLLLWVSPEDIIVR